MKIGRPVHQSLDNNLTRFCFGRRRQPGGALWHQSRDECEQNISWRRGGGQTPSGRFDASKFIFERSSSVNPFAAFCGEKALRRLLWCSHRGRLGRGSLQLEKLIENRKLAIAA